MLCVIFVLSFNIQNVFAFKNEQIKFYYNGKVFIYSLSENIKESNQFDLNYEINKYKRFSTKEERIKLLKKLDCLGFDKEISINYLFPNFNKFVDKIEKTIYIKPKDANLKIDSNSKKVFHITNEIVGVYVDKLKIYEEVFDAYINNKELKFNLTVIKTKPKVVGNDFKRFTNLRSDFSTDLGWSSADRKHNIKNALYKLNKYEVYPNQEFSFNKVIGRRTPENGYRNAKIIVNNEFVDGVGGGVCQVSSTLYNAALLAGLDVVEANKHSKQVGYVKHGFDAMVNFGSSDLRFVNNTNEKIIIITNLINNKARIRIYGEDLHGVSYKLKNEILNIEQPNEEIKFDTNFEYLDKVQYEDEFFYEKNGQVGMEIKSYIEKYINGELISTYQLRHDKFKVQNAVKVYGVKKREKLLDFALKKADCSA